MTFPYMTWYSTSVYVIHTRSYDTLQRSPKIAYNFVFLHRFEKLKLSSRRKRPILYYCLIRFCIPSVKHSRKRTWISPYFFAPAYPCYAMASRLDQIGRLTAWTADEISVLVQSRTCPGEKFLLFYVLKEFLRGMNSFTGKETNLNWLIFFRNEEGILKSSKGFYV